MEIDCNSLSDPRLFQPVSSFITVSCRNMSRLATVAAHKCFPVFCLGMVSCEWWAPPLECPSYVCVCVCFCSFANPETPRAAAWTCFCLCLVFLGQWQLCNMPPSHKCPPLLPRSAAPCWAGMTSTDAILLRPLHLSAMSSYHLNAFPPLDRGGQLGALFSL